MIVVMGQVVEDLLSELEWENEKSWQGPRIQLLDLAWWLLIFCLSRKKD